MTTARIIAQARTIAFALELLGTPRRCRSTRTLTMRG